MKELHSIQLSILRNLLLSDGLRYTDMKPDKEMENNQFSFHLNSLIDTNLVLKDDDKYRLTDKGKEYANRMDTDDVKMMTQAKLSAWCCCVRGSGHGKEVLIGVRKKQPFYGCQGFVAGKIKFGETIYDAAKRELREEAGLEGDPKLVQIKHYISYKGGKLVEDKFMFLFMFENIEGELKPNYEVELKWVPIDELPRFITKPFRTFDEIKEAVDSVTGFDGNVSFVEGRGGGKFLVLTRLHNNCYNVGVMIKQLLKNKRNQTVFSVSDIAIFSGRKNDQNLIANINYYVGKGEIIRISKGLYSFNEDYNKFEFGNKLRRPSYLSFYTVLQLSGVVFQEYSTIYFASNRSEALTINGVTYRYCKLKDDILLNPLGIENKYEYSVATLERALCDQLYLSGIEYFDNLSKVNWNIVDNLVTKVYYSKKLKSFINKLKNVR